MKKQKYIPLIQPAEQVAPVLPKLPFDVWWSVYSAQRQLSQELRSAVICHFKARGFWETQDWNAGIKDFGFKD